MIHAVNTQFIKMLKNLSQILGKANAYAEAKKFDPVNLLSARLAPDQFDFTRQVQITCDTAKSCADKLTDKSAPKHEDNETTFAQLQDRIGQTVSYLESIGKDDWKGWETRKTTNPRREGKFLAGDEYAMQHSLPNFYFHLTTTYAILRHNGLDIGKKDYLGAMNWQPL